MKIKKEILKKYLLILIILFVNFFLYAENITTNAFELTSSCDEGASDMSESKRDNLEDAIDQFVKKFNNALKNPENDCLPKALRDIMQDRLCHSYPIQIECENLKERKKEIWVKDKCGRMKKIIIVIKPQGGAKGYWSIQIDTNLLSQSPDNIEETLFHEVIHSTESFYGWNKYKNPNISTEDYTYTCTKSCYSNAKPCPPSDSKCLPCENYKLPSNK